MDAITRAHEAQRQQVRQHACGGILITNARDKGGGLTKRREAACLRWSLRDEGRAHAAQRQQVRQRAWGGLSQAKCGHTKCRDSMPVASS